MALHGQELVISKVRALVDQWRGFQLGHAREAYPETPPAYEPTLPAEQPVSDTTRRLLLHWFRAEPHEVGPPSNPFPFKYWPHQRRLVETFIYLHEVRGIRRTEQLYALAGAESLGQQRDPWAKLGGQLATGSGKTKMMSLIVTWAQLNAVCEGEKHLGIGRHAILIAPGLFVRDRLAQDFSPANDAPSVFFSDPVIPPELAQFWALKVYTPATCPLKLDPAESALVVTNYHQLLRSSGGAVDVSDDKLTHQMDLLFSDGEPQKLEDGQSPLIDRLTKSRGLLVINDEAHHVKDEPEHARFEEKARGNKAEEEEMAWIRCIRRLNGGGATAGRVALQCDLSATLFEETGAATSKAGKKTEFKPADLFRHTAVHYGLAEAIKDGIVKKPILERVEVHNSKTGEAEPLIRDGQPNAWEQYRNLLVTGIKRWKKVREQFQDEGDKRKPILFLICEDKKQAREIGNFLSYGEAVNEDLSGRAVTGWRDPETNEDLFVETDAAGARRSTVVEIHIGWTCPSSVDRFVNSQAAA